MSNFFSSYSADLVLKITREKIGNKHSIQQS
jgi:hypothetical protein